MNVTCENVTDLLPALARADLAESTSSEVRAHIAMCDVCAAEWALVTSLHTSLPPVPAELHVRISAAVSVRPIARRASFGARQLAIAATIVVAVIGAPLAVRQISQSDVATTPSNDSIATSATTTNAVSPAYVSAAPVLGSSSVLPDMTEAQLEALLAKMGS